MSLYDTPSLECKIRFSTVLSLQFKSLDQNIGPFVFSFSSIGKSKMHTILERQGEFNDGRISILRERYPYSNITVSYDLAFFMAQHLFTE